MEKNNKLDFGDQHIYVAMDVPRFSYLKLSAACRGESSILKVNYN
jgi:hypothetical protein